MKNWWVRDVLEQSLHEQVLITLGLEERPEAVARPWNLLFETGGSSTRPLPAGTTVSTLFDRIGTGRTLLILGEPGSGKTISLLHLARDLIARAEQESERLIPVVLNLSSWTPTQRLGQSADLPPLNAWLVEELSSKYQVPRQVGKTWIKRQRLLLLLDGLDEVQVAHRNDCVDALNAFQQESGTEMVVCCRRQEYERLNSRLHCQTAISLQALTLQQSQSYLNQLRADLRGLNSLLTTDRALQELAKSPLLLNIMVLAYQGVAVADLPETQVLEVRQRQLLDTYIRRMLTHRGQAMPYAPSRTLGWLIWLAQQMVRESQTVFLIETMQPRWVQGWARVFYLLGTLLVLGLIVGLVIARVLGLIVELVVGLGVGLLAWLAGGKIEPVEKLTWSWKKAGKKALVGLVRGLGIGLGVGLLAWLGVGLLAGLAGRLSLGLGIGLGVGLLVGFAGLGVGLAVGLVGGLAAGLGATKIEATTKPSQGMWNSAKNFALVGLVGGLLFGLVGLLFGLLFRLLGTPVRELAIGLNVGLNVGLLSGLVGLDYGGAFCIQHFTLRLILCRQGHIPWNYARFLDKAVEHLFLQRVGGGYIFIHRLLLEHFAAMTDQQVKKILS
ncbi:NACHT domain-containing protein [Phormidesmis priestleyi]|uniref:NACHT domain-containing protein n=1 Tax=Phormidesmis priestleyi TaxID=268141 RepID=UPI00083B5BC4|nr:NACHT domain-containing protein [Phormidesmis priestleyi]